MRAQYSIGLLALCAASLVGAGCPPGLIATATAVAKLRSVGASFSPPCRTIPLAAVQEELDRKLRRDLPMSPELYLEVLVRLGLVGPEGRTAYSRLLDFYASQILGFYEPSTDEMVLVDSALLGSEQARLVWAHELAHAAQEHRFSLPTRLLGMQGNSDAQRAASAVAEGEAMLVMLLLGANAGEASPDALAQAERIIQEQASLLAPPPGVPEYFVADLLFPYAQGFTAVLRSYRQGGWAAVDAMLAEPPRSTAELLHPQRGGAAGELAGGVLPPTAPRWEEITSDTIGEWGLAFWLSRQMPTEDASRLAAWWQGDRMRLIRDAEAPNRWALAWHLRTLPGGRDTMLAALERHLPVVLRSFRQDRTPPVVELAAVEDGVLLRADWPEPPTAKPRLP